MPTPQNRMNQPRPGDIAARLRKLAKLPSLHPHAAALLECASELDRSQTELQHLRSVCRGLYQGPTPEDLHFLRRIDEIDRRARLEEEAEAASGP